MDAKANQEAKDMSTRDLLASYPKDHAMEAASPTGTKAPQRVKTKDERIRSERQRLKKHYKDLEPAKMALAAGLIERAAFMRVECEDLEADLRENGWTEPFQQAKGMDPYDRARPQGQAYQSLNNNYQKIIRQLDAMLPQADGAAFDDGFGPFVRGRDAP